MSDVASWSRALGVTQRVCCEQVSCLQVLDEGGRPGAELVGVVTGAVRAVIYHTRPLETEDIVHELLHVRHPDWTEEMVVRETSRLLGGRSNLLDQAA